jgi:hypothetical protein
MCCFRYVLSTAIGTGKPSELLQDNDATATPILAALLLLSLLAALLLVLLLLLMPFSLEL